MPTDLFFFVLLREVFCGERIQWELPIRHKLHPLLPNNSCALKIAPHRSLQEALHPQRAVRAARVSRALQLPHAAVGGQLAAARVRRRTELAATAAAPLYSRSRVRPNRGASRVRRAECSRSQNSCRATAPPPESDRCPRPTPSSRPLCCRLCRATPPRTLSAPLATIPPQLQPLKKKVLYICYII